MNTYAEFERNELMRIKLEQERDLDCIKCPKCFSQWFEEIKLQRYQNQTDVVIGQSVPARPGSLPFILLKCIYCNNLVEPRIIHSARDLAGKDYGHFRETLEGKQKDQKKETLPDQKEEDLSDQIDTKEV